MTYSVTLENSSVDDGACLVVVASSGMVAVVVTSTVDMGDNDDIVSPSMFIVVICESLTLYSACQLWL